MIGKLGYFVSRGASKIGLTPGKRLKLSIKYNLAKKKLGNKIFDIKKHIKQHPKKYATGSVGLSGLGLYAAKNGKKKNRV